MPPLRFQSFLNPAFCRKGIASAERFPLRQWTTISLRTVEFVHAPRQFSERNQFPVQIADLILVRFAHVQNKQIIAAVLPGLQIFRCNFWNPVRHCRSLLTTNSAEFFIINQLCDRRDARRTSGNPDSSAASVRGSAWPEHRTAATARPADLPRPGSA